MEYVFGTQEDIEVLKTKGSEHSDLTGFHQIERSYPDQTVTDCFRVVRKLDSLEDGEGNCYDWYEIDRHYRFTDKTGPVADVVIVTGDEDLLVISDDGTIIRMDVGSISLLSRSTQGVRVMRLTGDAKVISIAPTDKEDSAEADSPEAN